MNIGYSIFILNTVLFSHFIYRESEKFNLHKYLKLLRPAPKQLSKDEKKELRGWFAKPTPFKRASSDELPNPKGLRAHTSSFTINEMVNVVLGPNPSPYPEPSLICGKTPRNSASLGFYIDGVFGAFHSFHILRVHFFPRMIWLRIKLMLARFE